MEIDGKAVLYAVAIVLVLVLILASFGVISFSPGKAASSSESSMPDKCKVPPGQDINSWKEHLGHHAETKDCLKYFN